MTRSDAPARLVVRMPNWLGDAVMALPALAAVRAAWPSTWIAVAALPWRADHEPRWARHAPWAVAAYVLVVMAWVFGWLAGAGLPPTATYIIGAVVIVRPMQELGVNPWVAHFFVFLMSVWGELSPPTSQSASALQSAISTHARSAPIRAARCS